MAKIDIRTLHEDEDITQIEFASKAVHPDREDTAHFLGVMNTYPDYIFIENARQYSAVRKSDIKNLIKALQKAEKIWGCN